MADNLRLNAAGLEDRLVMLRAGIRKLMEQAHSLNWAIGLLPPGIPFVRVIRAELRLRLRELEEETDVLRRLYSRTWDCISHFEELERDLARLIDGSGEARRYFAGTPRAGLLPPDPLRPWGWRPLIASLYRNRRYRTRWYRISMGRPNYIYSAKWRNRRLKMIMASRIKGRNGGIIAIAPYRYGHVPSQIRRYQAQTWLRTRGTVYRKVRSFVPGWLRRLY